ncbi:MAG: hypothetical protein MZW92_73440 [Comamonadaceae bacterium]|nr:hypothetical protein [Comamonadaceae bacterium]
MAAAMGASSATTAGGFPAADVDEAAGPGAGTGSADLSPNTAERMQQTHAGGAFAGASGGGATPGVFPEAERQDGEEPRPGLPDFARGA